MKGDSFVGFNIRDAIEPTLVDLAENFPKDFDGALKDVGARFRKRMRAEVQAGGPAGTSFPELDPLTILLKTRQSPAVQSRIRRRLKRAGGGTLNVSQRVTNRITRDTVGFGGRLPRLIEYNVAGSTLDATLSVGWLGDYFSGANKSAYLFQELGRVRPFTKAEHRMIRIILGTTFKQPREYRKPTRSAVSPYLAEFTEDVRQTIMKSITNRIRNRNKKMGIE